jgi:hypothetical protein
MARIYRTNVTERATALQQPESRVEATEALRGLVDAIVLTPAASGKELGIELRGNLAVMLEATVQRKRPSESDNLSLRVTLVAGARCRHWRRVSGWSRPDEPGHRLPDTLATVGGSISYNAKTSGAISGNLLYFHKEPDLSAWWRSSGPPLLLAASMKRAVPRSASAYHFADVSALAFAIAAANKSRISAMVVAG